MAARRGTLPVRYNTNCNLLKITVRRSARMLRSRGIPASNIGSATSLPYVYICILPSKTQHMYINALMNYQLHQGYMFRPWNSHHQANAEHIQGTLADGCFTAETCSPDVIDISSMRWYTYVVFWTVKYIYLLLHNGMAPIKKKIPYVSFSCVSKSLPENVSAMP